MRASPCERRVAGQRRRRCWKRRSRSTTVSGPRATWAAQRVPSDPSARHRAAGAREHVHRPDGRVSPSPNGRSSLLPVKALRTVRLVPASSCPGGPWRRTCLTCTGNWGSPHVLSLRSRWPRAPVAHRSGAEPCRRQAVPGRKHDTAHSRNHRLASNSGLYDELTSSSRAGPPARGGALAVRSSRELLPPPQRCLQNAPTRTGRGAVTARQLRRDPEVTRQPADAPP